MTEHVFALCALLGFQFAPRIPGLKHRRLYSFAKPCDRLGEIRDRTYENQQHRFSGLNLLVTAVTLWNTRYLERALAALREVEDVPDHLLAHLSPLGWEHVNLTGDYVWGAAAKMSENPHGYLPLRTAPEPMRKAA